MVHANAVIHGDRAKLLAMDASEHPVALQLGGSEPALLAQAARIGAEAGFDEVNLNCGCPSDRVQAGRFGACLMREPALAADSVAAMIEAAPGIPVTVKCRLGVDDDHDWDRFLAFVDAIADAGCRMFIVHARNAWLQGLSPKENREVPPLRYDWAYRLKAERPDCRSWSTAASPTAAMRARTSNTSMARCSAAPPTTRPTCCTNSTWRGSAATRNRARSCCAYRPRRGATRARRAAQAHRQARARPVRRAAGRTRVPAGAERRRAQTGADWSLLERALALTETTRGRGMITRDPDAFFAYARGLATDFGPATARAAFLVAPDGFRLAEQSARDNAYMADAMAFDAQRASMQHRELQRAISNALPTVCFAGDPATPDAVFPNNVFATAAGGTSSAACATKCGSAKRRARTSAASSPACSITPRSTSRPSRIRASSPARW